ncbi:MAG: DNA repair protein RadC [bacterium]
MSIKDWPIEERPVEKLQKWGPQYLSDAELLAILLSTGSAHGEISAVACCRLILKSYSSLRELGKATSNELCQFPGIGLVKSARIQAAFELAKRSSAEKMCKGSRYQKSQEVFDSFAAGLRDENREVFLVLLMDSKNRLIREERISLGSLTCSIVHPREVYNPAIRACAASVLFVHNHPSGDPAPSEEDRQLTRRLVDAGGLLGIRVLDHVIIGHETYYSFYDQGHLRRDPAM